MKQLGMVAVIGAAIVGLKAEPADACSFVAGVFERDVVPANDRAAVPVNAEVRVMYDVFFDVGVDDSFTAGVALRSAGGDLVEATATPVFSDARLGIVLRPNESLEPTTTYEVIDAVIVPCESWDSAQCIRDEPEVVGTFTTGTAADEAAPAFDGLVRLDSGIDVSEENNSCGEWASIRFSLAWQAATDNGDDGDVRYNVYSRDGTLRLPYANALSATGEAVCDGGHPLFTDFWGVTGEYYVRAVDAAGNEDDNDVRFATKLCSDVGGDGGGGGGGDDGSEGGGGGCSVPGSAGSCWLVLFALVTLRRRHGLSRDTRP